MSDGAPAPAAGPAGAAAPAPEELPAQGGGAGSRWPPKQPDPFSGGGYGGGGGGDGMNGGAGGGHGMPQQFGSGGGGGALNSFEVANPAGGGGCGGPPPEPAAARPPEPQLQPPPAAGATAEDLPEREPPLLKTLNVVVKRSLVVHGRMGTEQVEDVDINAPLAEVLAQLEEALDDCDFYAEDIVSVSVMDRVAQGVTTYNVAPVQAAPDEYEDTTLAELGFEDGFHVYLLTAQFIREEAVGRNQSMPAMTLAIDHAAGQAGQQPWAGAGGRRPQEKAKARAAEEATMVGGKHRVPSTVVYDFRRCDAGKLPRGVTLVDPAVAQQAAGDAGCGGGGGGGVAPKPELEEQSDRSMAVLLKGGQYLELNLDPDAPADPATPWMKQKKTAAYTITMDLKLEQLPENNSLGLFSPSADGQAPAALCQLDQYGGVGAFAQFGVKAAAVKVGRWSRIVVTVKLGREAGMTTYTVGPKGVVQCAEVQSNYFVPADGALVLSKSKMRLFYSTPDGTAAVGEDNRKIMLKYVSVKRRHMDLDLVRAHVEKDRIFDYTATKEDEDEDEKQGSLFLHGVRGAKMGQPARVVPLFVTPPFLCEFACEMLRGSGWTGGSISMAIPVLAKVLEVVLEPDEAPPLFRELCGEFGFDAMELQSLNGVCKVLRDGAKLSQKFKLAEQGGPQLVQFLKLMKKRTAALQVGASMIVPGGTGYPHPGKKKKWVTTSLVYILERISEQCFRFVVVNTDIQGLAYHELSAANSAPVFEYKVCMVLDGIPKARMLDDAWWLFVLKIVGTKHHPASKRLYDLLLPWLTDKPLEESFTAATEADFRRPHDSDSSFYRCGTESIFYLLRRQGFSADRAEQVVFAMRSMMIIQADQDLFHAAMGEREARFLKIAWQQYANSTAELERRKLLSVGQLLQSKAVIEQLKTHVETRLMWQSWSAQAELNEMHVFASAQSIAVSKPMRVLFIASIADGGHEGIAASLMKEAHELEKVVDRSGGGLKAALPANLYSNIDKYSEVQTKLKQCADSRAEGPLILHFSSHGNDDDQTIRFEGNTDIGAFARDIAAAKPAVVILSACLTLPLALAIWEVSDADAKPTIVSWAKPVGTVVAEVFSKAFYGFVGEAATSGKVLVKGGEEIAASDPLGVRKILHQVAVHKKLVKEILVVDEPEAAATRETPQSTRSDGPPPPLKLNAAEKSKCTPSLLPFMETLHRKESVDGLAGTASDTSKYVPVNFLRLPQSVSSVAQALDCLRVCDELCMLIHSQSAMVKNSAHLRTCLIEHVFVHIVPVPQPAGSAGDCIWSQSLTYSQQLDFMILLQRIVENFASAVLSLHPTKSLDAVRIVVVACITAVADSVMRRRASDIPSPISTHLLGEAMDGSDAHSPFGIDTALFAQQSETCEVHTPELNVARSGVLDYFSLQTHTVKIFSWEKGNKQQKTTNEFLNAIAKERVYGVAERAAFRLLDNGGYSADRHFGSSGWELHKLCPEFGPYRDICYYFKFFLNPDLAAFPEPTLYAYPPNAAALHWEWNSDNSEFIVAAKFNKRFPYGSPLAIFQLSCVPGPKVSGAGKNPKHRYPSGADVTIIIDEFVNLGEENPVSIDAKTEDDILHLRNLPTFDNSLTASDSEMLLSFLTEPYLRIPLVLSFFATEDRIHALKQEQLRQLLDAVLWEPGQFGSVEMSSQAPIEVPTSKPEHLGTAHGLMLNEIIRSPSVVIDATVKLLKLALDLNTGSAKGSTTEVILYVCRMASRIDSYVKFVIDISDGTHHSMRRTLRDVDVSPQTVAQLKAGLAEIRDLLHGDLLALIKDYSNTEYREYKDSADEATLNSNTRIMSCLHAHLILMMRNIKGDCSDSQSVQSVMALMASFVHINCRHSFNTGRQLDLPDTKYFVPELQLYETLQVQRRRLVNWAQGTERVSTFRHTELTAAYAKLVSRIAAAGSGSQTIPDACSIALCREIASLGDISASPGASTASAAEAVASGATPSELNVVMSTVQRITSDTGSWTGSDKETSAETVENWGFLSGQENVGRFAVTSLGSVGDNNCIASAESSEGLGAEIDFQLAALTVKNSHVVALNEDVANMPDVKAVFGNESMQATQIQSAEHRDWFRLMGRGHDIQYWKTNDPRKFKGTPECFGEFERDYFEDLDKKTEMWAAKIFEPIRKMYFCPPGQPPIRFLMRVEPAKDDASVITMLAVHADGQGAWKEVVISKSHETVQCYECLSHGRRWYKSLQYCNDRRFALRCLEPDMTQIRKQAWPEWERHGGGHPLLVHSSFDMTTVITRSWGITGKHSRNLSGGVETYLPARLLFGLLPEALLDPKLAKDDKDRVKHVDRYEFWQSEDDKIRGYPVSEDQHYIIEVEMRKTDPVDCTKVKGTSVKVQRVSRTKVEREYAEIIKASELIISTKLLATNAFGSSPKKAAGAKGTKMKEAAAVQVAEEAPVAFELFTFVKSLANEYGYQVLQQLIGALGNSGNTFETRVQLRKVIADAAAEEPAAENDQLENAVLDEEMELLDMLYAEKDTWRYSLAKVISRLDTLAHVLCWSRRGSESISVVELPRLSLTFVASKDKDGNVRLESSDHAGLFIHAATFGLSRQTAEMLSGIPHSLVLTDANGQHTILCAALPLLRPIIPEDPFSTELVLDRHKLSNDRRRKWVSGRRWAKRVDKYFLYPVHVSKTFLLHRTMQAAIYLLILRLLNRNYQAAFALANAIATDKEYSNAEACIFKYAAEAGFDHHPDAVACRLKISSAVSAVPSVKILTPWDLTVCMSTLVLNLRVISAATRMPHSEMLQLLELCCTSAEDDDYDPKRHTGHCLALVSNMKALLSSTNSGQMQLKQPARLPGSGWAYVNHKLVYSLDRHSPGGTNIKALHNTKELPTLLSKTSGELLALLVHEQPLADTSNALRKAMFKMSTDRRFRAVIFRHVARNIIDDDETMSAQMGVRSTPHIIFYKLDAESGAVVDESLVGTKIRARKSSTVYSRGRAYSQTVGPYSSAAGFQPNKQYDAEVVAVNTSESTLHLRYDDDDLEDEMVPVSLTEIGRGAGDKTEQLVTVHGTATEDAVGQFEKIIERLIDEPEDEMWREELIVGDTVDVAISDTIKCSSGHSLVQYTGTHHSCDVCGKNGLTPFAHINEQNGLTGTEWRCSERCDYDMCKKCHEAKSGANLQWYKGIIVSCSGDDVTVHFEMMPNDKNIRLQWGSSKLKERGTAGGYHYSSLKPNPEDEKDEAKRVLWGHKHSGLTAEQFVEKQSKWGSYADAADGAAVDAFDALLAERLERGFQRGHRLGIDEFAYAHSGQEYKLDLSIMQETELASGETRKLTRTDPAAAKGGGGDQNESLLEEYTRLVGHGELTEGKEMHTLVVTGLRFPGMDSPELATTEFCDMVSMLKQRSDARMPDDGWGAEQLQDWCSANLFVPGEATQLIEAIHAYLSDDGKLGPIAGFDRCISWDGNDAGGPSYFLEYPTAASASRAQRFIQDQPSKKGEANEFSLERNPGGRPFVSIYPLPDSKSKADERPFYQFRSCVRALNSFVPDKAGTGELFLEVEDARFFDGEPFNGWLMMETSTGVWKPLIDNSAKVASAEFLSSLKLKSGQTWGRIKKHWKNMTLHYTETRKLTGHAVLESMSKIWDGKESCEGSHAKHGFLFLYSLFTAKTRVKVVDQDNSHTLATLFTRMLLDCDAQAMLPSILNQLARNPRLCDKLSSSAVYADKRKKREKTVSSEPVGSEDSPLETLFDKLIPQMVELQAVAKPDAGKRCVVQAPPASCAVPAAPLRSWVVQKLTDYASSRRIFKSYTGELAVDATARAAFMGSPLQSIVSDPPTPIIAEATRADMNMDPLVGTLPFDVSRHEQARSSIAQKMLNRLAEDVKEYADAVNAKVVRSLACLDPATSKTITTAASDGGGESARLQLISDAEKALLALKGRLQSLRAQDQRFVDRATPLVLEMASEVALPMEDDEDFDATDTHERYRYVLRREGGQEPRLAFEFIVGALLSSNAVQDLQTVNPYLTEASIDMMFNIAVAAILSANRVSQINRCLNDGAALEAMLKQTKLLPVGTSDASLSASLKQKSQSLASQLQARRHYFDGEAGEFHPAFLVFEYVGEQQLMLRKAQVQMVRMFVGAESVVKQMIMGAGKTTVIAPLLALMLGDGKNLVVSVVPKALLDMSRNVMRSTFSSIIEKRIYTLVFDRGSDVPATLVDKLKSARRERGVVIATPTTIKSLQLKFLELLSQISDVNRPRVPEMVSQVEMLAKVLEIFDKGVLLMDEVDVILHPLKSELNFPVGEKFDLDANPWRWELPIHIIECIFFADGGKVAVEFSESTKGKAALDALHATIKEGVKIRALQAKPHVILLNTEWYHQSMKPAVADWLLLWLHKQNVGRTASGLSDNIIRSYILGGANVSGATNDAERQRLEALHRAVSAAGVSDTDRKMLNLSRDWLKSFFPHCLSKIDRVTFGTLNASDFKRIAAVDPHMPDTRRYLAIPFEGKDVPSKSSEFAHPDVTIGLTIFAYRYEGLRYSDFDQIMNALRATLAKEVGPLSQRKSSLLHENWVTQAGGIVQKRAMMSEDDEEEAVVPGIWLQHCEQSDTGAEAWEDLPAEERDEWMAKALVVPLRLLKRSNSGQMKKLYDLLREEPKIILWFLQEIIFPTHMRHQHLKLSSSGQDLGGDVLFPKRIGFSGTPSDLLPMELGACDYERGSDGKMVAVMTDKDICSVEHLQDGWDARSILERIATADPPCKALIDTGALITGLSNLEVAKALTESKDRLPWCLGVVFLDEDDRKMILVRATGHVQELDTCGIAASSRFAFYDQVHTTGMDISHSLDATAVLTLGKDMNFRDYVQGAFRMRGIGQGQKVSIYIIPEVCQLIERELKAAGGGGATATTTENMLEHVTAWLVISSMRSERVQNNQLMVQNVANMYRKTAFREVRMKCASFDDVDMHQAIAAYCAGVKERLEESKRSSVAECIDCVLWVDHLPAVGPLKLKTLEDRVRSRVFKRLQGKIVRFEMPTDSGGKSQGMAFVEFASQEDAAAALSAEGEAGQKPNNFQFDKTHKLKVCPLQAQMESAEERALVPQSVLDSLKLFNEDIDFSLAGKVPEPEPFDEVLASMVSKHARWLDEKNQTLAQGIVDGVKGARISNHQAALEAEQTQEQEEEREKELEDEKEKEIEVEKFSDAAYSRENEAPIPWAFANLADVARCDQFYGGSDFKLFKRKALALPDYVQFSRNYFNPKWSGERRLKNVVMLLEWVPKLSLRTGTVEQEEALTSLQEETIDRAIGLFAAQSTSADDSLTRTMTADDATTVMAVIRAACDLDIDDNELRQVINQFRHEQRDDAPRAAAGGSPGRGLVRTLSAGQGKALELLRVCSAGSVESHDGHDGLDRGGIRRLLLSAKFREVHTGHYTVAISLAEAATIRRIMHLGSGRLDLVTDGNFDTALALRVLPAGNIVLDKSLQFQGSLQLQQHMYQQCAACEMMRFINCDMHFSEPQLNTLLRLLKRNTERERRRFFLLTIGCRRRLQLKFENTPVMRLFSIRDEWVLLRQRALASFIREGLKRRGISYGDAFTFIRGAHHIIRPQHIVGAFAWLGDHGMTPREATDFVRASDADGDGCLNYEEFLAMLNTEAGATEAEDFDDDDGGGGEAQDGGGLLHVISIGGTTHDHIQPMHTASIMELEQSDAEERRRELELEEQSEREEREAMMKEMEIEQERENENQPGGPNPRIEGEKLTWWFTRPRDPKAMKYGGSGNVSRAAVRLAYPAGDPPLEGGEVTRVMSSTYLQLQQPLRQESDLLDRYSLSMHVRIESSLPTGKHKLALLATKEDDPSSKAFAFVIVDSKGDIRFTDGTAAMVNDLDDTRVHIKRYQWFVISIAVDAIEGSARCWVNGKLHCTVEDPLRIKRQGRHSLSTTCVVFGSSEKTEMQGVKLITMIELQTDVLDDARAKAVAVSFTGSSESRSAGSVELARLHSAVGYRAAETRIEQLQEMTFSDQKRYSRTEVLHALTTVHSALGQQAVEPLPTLLTAKTATESMIGCRVELPADLNPRDGGGGADGEEEGKAVAPGVCTLLGYQIAGVKYGNFGDLSADDPLESRDTVIVCHDGDEDSSRHHHRHHHEFFDGLVVFEAPPGGAATYSSKMSEDGTPSRDFQIGTLVKAELLSSQSGQQRGKGGRRWGAPPAPKRGGTTSSGAAEEVVASGVFVVVALQVSEDCWQAGTWERELTGGRDTAAAGGARRGRLRGGSKGGSKGGGKAVWCGSVFEVYDPTGYGKDKRPNDYMHVKPLAASEKLEPIEGLLQACKTWHGAEPADELLAKYGVFEKSTMAVAVSNWRQQIGDMATAISSLQERATALPAAGGGGAA